MNIKDELYSWFIRNVAVPRSFDFTRPGYILSKNSSDPKGIMLRDLFIPEDLVCDLETKTVEKLGTKGNRLLYAIGKNSCYIYSKFCGIETIKTKTQEKEYNKYTKSLLLFLGAIYGAAVDYFFDVKIGIQRASFSQYVVCRKNGIGDIFLAGSAAGLCSWLLQDTSTEVVQTECTGKGAAKCRILIASPEKIKQLGYTPVEFPGLFDMDMSKEYLSLNQPKNTVNAKKSLRDQLKNKTMSYKNGQITFYGGQYFNCDSHYIYFLEWLYNDDVFLFDLAKEYYKKLGEAMGEKLGKEYIADILGSMGWGDIAINDKKEVQVNCYPYTDLYNKTRYPIIRGMLSGLMTALYKEDVNLLNAKTSLEKDSFSLALTG